MWLLNMLFLGHSYSKGTLRFGSHRGASHVKQIGFEDLFVRLWVFFLTGLSESCLDELALESLFPLPLLHNYVRLVSAHIAHIYANTHKGV